MPNGDLSSHLEILGQFPEETVKSILAQLFLALKELKKEHIVHGDIKLENILYSGERGIIKLADFGLSFEKSNPTKSALGTPEYMSPELITESKKGYESDIWATGICAYEMLFGIPPFYDESAENILAKIISKNESHLDFGRCNVSGNAKDLIKKLLTFDYTNRLSLEGAMKHDFFASIDWSSPPKVSLPEFDSIFEERNKRYISLQYYNLETISTEVITYESGVFNQNTSLQNQIDLLKLFPVKNINKLTL